MRLVLLPLLLAAVVAVLPSAEADGLRRAPSCAALVGFFRRNALARLKRLQDQARLDREPQPEADPASPGGAGNDGGFSGTNNQFADVEEPDIVKTDGRRIVFVRDKTLLVVRAEPGGMRGKIVGRLQLRTTAYSSELLLFGDVVMVLSEEYSSHGGPVVADSARISARRPPPFLSSVTARSSPPFGLQTVHTLVQQVSLAADRPRLQSTLRVAGRLVAARQAAGLLRLITRFSPFLPRILRRPESGGEDVRRSKLAQWMADYTMTSEPCPPDSPGAHRCGRRRKRRVSYCRNSHFPRAVFGGFSTLSVITIRISRWPMLYLKSRTIVSDADVVTMTVRSLFVATTPFAWDIVRNSPQEGRLFETSLHRFALGRKSAAYAAHGEVQGSVLNQFSMHERDEHLLVATTLGANSWELRDASKSRVTSFEQRSGRLHPVSVVGGLGKGERIFSVRYVGTKAYVVTFREVDPFYLIDISDVSNLRLRGELKIPGFSTYLHPFGNDRVIGVGRGVASNGQTTGTKVSLFDVSDASEPREISVWTLRGSYTSAEWNHKAFLFWEADHAVVLPLVQYSKSFQQQFSGSVVLSVTSKKISERGRVTHSSPNVWENEIQRNLILGGKWLWSLSEAFLQVNDIRSLTLASKIKLPEKVVRP